MDEIMVLSPGQGILML